MRSPCRSSWANPQVTDGAKCCVEYSAAPVPSMQLYTYVRRTAMSSGQVGSLLAAWRVAPLRRWLLVVPSCWALSSRTCAPSTGLCTGWQVGGRVRPGPAGLPGGQQAELLNDDRAGRTLDRLFAADGGSLLTALMTGVISEFGTDCSQRPRRQPRATDRGARQRQAGARRAHPRSPDREGDGRGRRPGP